MDDWDVLVLLLGGAFAVTMALLAAVIGALLIAFVVIAFRVAL